jgi:hypothetical protein
MTHTTAPRAAGGGGTRDPLLRLGVLLPLLYFGIQLAAAPFYPAYSFLNRDASTLGSGGSTAPWIFNYGALVVGGLEVAIAAVFYGALRRARIGAPLAGALALALVSAAIGSLNAFLHPLPDPQHTDGPLAILGSGLMFLPLLSIAVLWRLGARRAAMLTAVACVALVPMMTGLVQRICMKAGVDFSGYQTFLNGSHGLIQRLGALVVFGPVALIALRLRRGPGRDVPLAVLRRSA